MNKKILYTTLLLTFFACINNVKASEYNNYIVENLNIFSPNKNFNIINDNIIKEENLEIGKIKYLPNSFKYNIKIANSFIDMALSINKIDKINLQIKESLTNIKELEFCYKKNDSLCTENAIKNYKTAKSILYKKLSKITDDKILQNLLTAEINENIILKNIQKTYKNTSGIYEIIEQDKIYLSNYINKSNIDLLNLKEIIKKSAEDQNKNKSFLNILVINEYLEELKISDKKTKTVFEQIIEENYKTFIENINNINIEKDNIDIEKNLRYYLYYKYNDKNIVSEINLINKLYRIQKDVNNSKIKNILTTAILNSKKAPIALLSISLENNISEINNIFENFVIGTDIEKMNVLLLLKKQNVLDESNSLSEALNIIENKYIDKIFSSIENLDFTEKEKVLTNYFEKLSNENFGFIKTILSKLEESQTNKEITDNNVLINKMDELLKNIDSSDYNDEYCPQDYKPICGINKKTYTNSCFIEMVSIKIDHSGECKIEENPKLPEITEKEAITGWYYGTRQTKKPGTPTNWVLIDENTQNSKWTNPKNILNIK